MLDKYYGSSMNDITDIVIENPARFFKWAALSAYPPSGLHEIARGYVSEGRNGPYLRTLLTIFVQSLTPYP